jgi:hypothetical protein
VWQCTALSVERLKNLKKLRPAVLVRKISPKANAHKAASGCGEKRKIAPAPETPFSARK